MESDESLLRRVPIYWLVFAGLVIYAVTLAVITGDTGFQTDDWWILSVPYWHSFPGSIWDYAVEFRRPLEGLPWLVLFPVIGFNRTAFNLVALLLLAGTSLLMGMCLKRAFPDRPAFIASTMLFSFFLPTICPLTYVFHMDNIWTCTLLFWGSVLAFQRWAEASVSPRGLIAPVLLYYLSTLAYDAANLLLFLVPLFVYPCRQRNTRGVSDRAFWFRLGAALAVGFSALLFTKFLVFRGGAVGLRAVFPPFKLMRSYVENFVPYLLEPFKSVPNDAWAVGIGIVVALFSAALLLRNGAPFHRDTDRAFRKDRMEHVYILLWAAGLILLGTFPYLMAGYGASWGFHGESRIYSAASFGVAILLGYAATVWRSRSVSGAAKLAAVVVLGFMATFHVDLRRSWQEAAKINCGLWTTLAHQCPNVAPGTSFLFLDLQSYVSNRAIIFGGVNGLTHFIRMFYHRKDINAHYLYPQTETLLKKESRLASVSPKGIVARGVLPSEPIALDKVLIAARVGSRLVLLDKISARDKLAAIRWEGVSEIRSNRTLILPAGKPVVPFRGVCCRWCGR